MAAKKGGLGRGLDALFADVPINAPTEEDIETLAEKDIMVQPEDRVNYISIHQIMANVNQPRKSFNEEKIEELAESIKEHGIIQPIVVRKKNEGYEIVTDFDVYEKFEQPLVKDGWDVIVFVPSKEEDTDRITCGNSLIALGN